MIESQSNNYSLTAEEIETIMTSLLHKEGCWVDWGKACHKLQQAKVEKQEIFEKTGLQTSQQNLVIVASQVYDSLVKGEAEEDLLTYYQGPRSDVLYEFRILNHEERLGAARLAKEKQLDVDGASSVAKAIKHFSHLSQPPTGFTHHPGDAVAYQHWKNARQKKTLADKARLIAEGLKFAHSPSARQLIEQLLTEATETSPQQNAPLLPIYRLENDEELPCILPVVGTFPLTVKDVDNIPSFSLTDPFGVTTISQDTQVVCIPSWQVILKAKHPAVILCRSEDLPKAISTKSEELLIVVDLAVKEWNPNHYFMVSEDDRAKFRWFASMPDYPILGQLLLILRPKKILDEGNLTEPWQMDD
ncbi:RuBisCO accumulation factor 1 [Geminocystis sp. CENA526]|uniref:RuBisCO accumulation factor 1 n=1 Tax=Geminocystis sp. CENA526 TaxID=1355871 RepID=UPI003D6FA712